MGVVCHSHTHRKSFCLEKLIEDRSGQNLGDLQVPVKILLATGGCVFHSHTHWELFWLLKANQTTNQTEIWNVVSKQLGEHY